MHAIAFITLPQKPDSVLSLSEKNCSRNIDHTLLQTTAGNLPVLNTEDLGLAQEIEEDGLALVRAPDLHTTIVPDIAGDHILQVVADQAHMIEGGDIGGHHGLIPGIAPGPTLETDDGGALIQERGGEAITLTQGIITTERTIHPVHILEFW